MKRGDMAYESRFRNRKGHATGRVNMERLESHVVAITWEIGAETGGVQRNGRRAECIGAR